MNEEGNLTLISLGSVKLITPIFGADPTFVGENILVIDQGSIVNQSGRGGNWGKMAYEFDFSDLFLGKSLGADLEFSYRLNSSTESGLSKCCSWRFS